MSSFCRPVEYPLGEWTIRQSTLQPVAKSDHGCRTAGLWHGYNWGGEATSVWSLKDGCAIFFRTQYKKGQSQGSAL